MTILPVQGLAAHRLLHRLLNWTHLQRLNVSRCHYTFNSGRPMESRLFYLSCPSKPTIRMVGLEGRTSESKTLGGSCAGYLHSGPSVFTGWLRAVEEHPTIRGMFRSAWPRG